MLGPVGIPDIPGGQEVSEDKAWQPFGHLLPSEEKRVTPWPARALGLWPPPHHPLSLLLGCRVKPGRHEEASTTPPPPASCLVLPWERKLQWELSFLSDSVGNKQYLLEHVLKRSQCVR